MDDIGAWLNQIGLGKYAETFAENDIDADVLPELTDGHLQELGLSLGHRVKLLKAIAALSSQQHPGPAPSVTPAPAAERRQLTVMFVDLVGSTALSAQLDPEDMRELILGYQDTVAGEISRFEGHVAKYMGDGVLAYFGWPQAHEDEAGRAVRAALAATSAVAQLRTPDGKPFAARVGIATGLVVVGDLIGDGAAREQAVVGETPNLAARLQALAEPGAVVIGESTRRLLGEVFKLSDLGTQMLKGFSDPIRAWQVTGTQSNTSRFEAYTQKLRSLIGREAELDLLLDRWQRASCGLGQVALLSGEAGIGKSRITQALQTQIAGQPHIRLSYQCSPYHTHSAFYPVIDQLQRAAGLSNSDTTAQKLDKLELLLTPSSPAPGEVVPLLAALLSIPYDMHYPRMNLAPERQKQLTLDALLDQLLRLSEDQPVLFILEDMHWIDPTTRELMELIVDRIQEAKVLVVITYRPELPAPWTDRPHVSLLSLSRLSQAQAAALIDKVTGGKHLPEEVLAQIIDKTDGVPLFVEELAKTMLESGLLRETDDRYILDGSLPALAVPSTLQDSLLARLDRLASVREIAQTGAVIGREFSYPLIAAVSSLADGELRAGLQRLIDAELIFARGRPPDAEYTFKHALVQDVAYGSLLKSTRRQLHLKIASALETQFPGLPESQPELLAHHLTEADQTEEAIDFWRRAGQRAVERSANAEAVGHLQKGLKLLHLLPESAQRHRRELDLQLALGNPLMATAGYGAAEVGKLYSRARELSALLHDREVLFPVLYGLWAYHFSRTELGDCMKAAESMLAEAGQRQDRVARMMAHRLLGITLLTFGKLTSALHHNEQALVLYDLDRDRRLAFTYAQDPRVATQAIDSWVRWQLGFPDQASIVASDSIAYARELDHPHTLAYAQWTRCRVCMWRGEVDAAQTQALTCIELASEHRFPVPLAQAELVHSWVRAKRGRLDDALAIAHSAIERYEATGGALQRAMVLANLADIYFLSERFDEARTAVEDGLQVCARTDARWWQPELMRLRGEVSRRLAPADCEAAERWFTAAIEHARQQEMKSWELRAATSLARLWRDQGRYPDACRLLAPVYGWFSEGFDTADLKNAKALLEEVAAS